VGAAVLPGMPLVALEPARAEVLDARSRAAAEARVAAATSAVGAADQRLRAARAGAALAGTALRRAEALRAAGHVSVAAVDEARAASDQAAAEQRSAEFGVATAGHELEAARTALGYAAAGGRGAPVLVKSPVAGQVLRIPARARARWPPARPSSRWATRAGWRSRWTCCRPTRCASARAPGCSSSAGAARGA
jgi:HlyD family secretion protein